MPGPYFVGQKQAKCGCYFPDVTRLRDDNEKGVRVLYCIKHGELSVTWPRESMVGKVCPIPNDAWREARRVELRQTGQMIVAVPRRRNGY